MPKSPHSRRTALTLPAIGFWGFMLLSNPLAAAPPVVTDFVVGPATITLTFQDDGSSNQFTLQKNIGLDAANWGNASDTVLSPLGANRYTFAVPRTSADKQFYRILATLVTGTPLDPDGDGIPTALEETFSANPSSPLYSNPNLFDTDGDGFSDGVEFAMGTLPNDTSSKPILSSLPTVNFVDADSIVSEQIANVGGGNYPAQIVFDRPFSGTVNYTINPMGNTTAGEDYAPVSGSVSVNGTSASIPIGIIDNATVSGQRVIIVDLTTNGDNYFIGGRGTHVILLEDNDAWWSGRLFPSSGEIRPGVFRLKIVSHLGNVSAEFGAGAGNDGFPIPVVNSASGAPAIASTNISSAIIPVGTWMATEVETSTDGFHAESPLMQLPAVSGSLYSQTLKRKLTLNVDPTLNTVEKPHRIETAPRRYVGDYSESLHNANNAALATFAGTFILERDLPAPLPVLSPLVPATP